MQSFTPRSVIHLLCLCLGIACCTCKTKPKEEVLVKKELKKDIINCRYPEQMPMNDNDTAIRSSNPK